MSFKQNKGILLALLVALISGFAVFFNKFAGKLWSDSFVFTTVKNIPVGLVFLGMILAPKFLKEIKNLNKKQWAYLLLISIIGGTIPFLMFFKGLTLTFAANAAFIHKTLFIWVGFLAVIFLKEKLGKIQLGAFGLLFVGNLILGGLKSWQFGAGDALIFGATILWSVEYILAKKILADTSSEIVGWARMFFGSVFMIIFLVATGRADGLASINLLQVKWILLSSALLFGYVFTWYKALKMENASLVTCFLVPASLITTLLNSIFVTGRFSVGQLYGSLLFSAALFLIVRFRPQKFYAIAKQTN